MKRDTTGLQAHHQDFTTLPWSREDSSRVPFSAYTDQQVHAKELSRFFYGSHWNYVGLLSEIPNWGDFKKTFIGEREVIMVKDMVRPAMKDVDHGVRVVENRCAHRGVRFLQESTGNRRSFVCPYHQWAYKLNGDLGGLPFKDGVQTPEEIQGGMPSDFELSEHGLTQLKVEVLHGLVFASFDTKAPDIKEYLGPQILPWIDRIFKGKTLTLLGYNRQRIPGNWKLMMENIKDPYHPGLLHTWFVTFGLWRADQKSRMIMDAKGRHAVMISTRNEGGGGAVTQGVTSFKPGMKLHDDRLLDIVGEPWWTIADPSDAEKSITPSVTMITLFPSVIIQQQVNSLSTRQIVPNGHGSFDFVWTHFGFEDDSAEMTKRRLRQANLFGPAGYVSADDGEVIELSQAGFEQWNSDGQDTGETICELGGREVQGTQHMVTETLIRGMYAYWREAMSS
jgi:salicylate 5-hydroxylase large subunit